MKALENQIATFFEVSAGDLESISSFFQPIRLEKGEYFLKEGTYAKQLGFLQEGILREAIHLPEKEITKWIATSGYFVTDLGSFLFNKPAKSSLQALTDCEMFIISLDDYRKLGEIIPTWNTVEKLFLAKCFGLMEERITGFIALTAEERYHQLWNAQKSLFNQVPLQYLASMLGMTPETFSRIRNKSKLNS